MSLIATTLARRLTLGDPLAKFVLLMLADRHNAETNACYPSLASLQADTELSPATLRAKLALLEARGLLRPGRDGRRVTAELTFVVADAIAGWEPAEETILSLIEEFPEHDVIGRLPALLAEWRSYAAAQGRGFRDLERAFAGSVRRALGRRRPGGGGGVSLASLLPDPADRP